MEQVTLPLSQQQQAEAVIVIVIAAIRQCMHMDTPRTPSKRLHNATFAAATRKFRCLNATVGAAAVTEIDD